MWIILVIVGLFLLIRWHAKNTAYICPKCGYKFMISTFEDFISPNILWDKKLLKCPKCKTKSLCKAISVKEQ